MRGPTQITMDTIINGKLRPVKDVQTADYLINMKPTSTIWEVCEEIIKIWQAKNPDTWKSYIVHVSDLQNTRKNKHAASENKETGMITRYIVDVPEQVVLMLRMIYSVEELPMDKIFWREFGRKFPAFRVAQRI